MAAETGNLQNGKKDNPQAIDEKVAPETSSPARAFGEDVAARALDDPKANEYDAKYLDEFLYRMGKAKETPDEISKFLEWAAKQEDSNILRRANLSLSEDEKDYYLKHVRLATAFLEKGEDVEGRAVFNVNFKGNDLAERKIGAGNLLPFSVKAIRVSDDKGNVVFDYAQRAVINGKVGYFVPNTNEYAYVHTGYKIEVLGLRDIPKKEDDKDYASFKEENDVFEKNEDESSGKEDSQKSSEGQGSAGGGLSSPDSKDSTEVNPNLTNLFERAAQIAKSRNPEVFVKGKCEQAVRTVVSRAIELATGKPIGSTDGIRIRNTRIDEKLTADLRGKKIKDLTMQDCQSMHPGTVIFMASESMYASRGVRINQGTNNKLPLLDETNRHWVMWDGSGFTDNWGAGRPLEALKKLAGGKNRVIINVHDPIGEYGAA